MRSVLATRSFIRLVPLLALCAVALAAYAAMPQLVSHAGELKAALVALRHFCLHNPWTGYFLFAVLLALILLAGLPLSSLMMLFAGIIYNFWEAAMLVTLSRLATAMLAFMLVRQLSGEAHAAYCPIRCPVGRTPRLMRTLQRHPALGLALARLCPIPDSVVNYSASTLPISKRDYALASLLGMIPFSLFAVWTGQQLGSIGSLLRQLY